MKRVMVGMSGGVDSSVAALLLKQQGYDVIGVTIKLWDHFDKEACEKVCCSIEDVYDAKKVCDMLEIPHYVVNFKKEFKKHVIDYFIDEYNSGNTPSPCIICNETIKFGKLLEFAKKADCDYIATGHYADVELSAVFGKKLLKRGNDSIKDQTYMLYRLSLEQIESTLFPLKGMTKEQVRYIAKENNLITYSKGDSQGICFVMGDYKRFLSENLGDKIKPGDFTDKTGKILGKHEGYQFYTIGQRRGLGLNTGHPYFITEIIPEENRIILGEFEELKAKLIKLRDIKLHIEIEEGMMVKTRPRFSSKGHDSKLIIRDDGLYIEYDNENAENAPGQHAVFYIGENVAGGGVIEKKIKK